MISKPDYRILLHPVTLVKLESYLALLQSGSNPGSFLKEKLSGINLTSITTSQFIEVLLNTKLPQIFAEISIFGDGSDWKQTELSLLGDISIAVLVTVYDDGRHRNPAVHDSPLDATLLFTPGALLQNGRGMDPADWQEIVANGQINQRAYNALYERRLLPPLIYASAQAVRRGRKSLVTIPGLGCGQFAGPFLGQLGAHLQIAILNLIDKHREILEGIRTVYFDTYSEGDNTRHDIGNISFMVRPLTKGNAGKPQLCNPRQYEELGDDFSDCDLFSVVAWDHASWPGNDFFVGSRATDDGVKAAATDSMRSITGIAGTYDEYTHAYLPPPPYGIWDEVVEANNIQLIADGNCLVLPGVQGVLAPV